MDGVSQPSTTPVRPPQVTVAVGIAMVGSVFVVLAVWDRIAGLHSLDTRDSLRSVLDDPLMRSNGVTLSQLIVTVKVVSMVAAACAAAIAVLGVQTLRRSRTARLGMTVLAVPMFLGGLAADGIFSSGVAAAVATLWFGPARLWFEEGSSTRDRLAAARVWPPPSGTTTPRPPADRPDLGRPPPRQPVEQQHWPPPTSPHPWAPPPTSTYDVRGDVRGGVSGRPNALLTACLLTWMFCSMAVILVGASLLVLAVDSNAVLDRMNQQDPQLADRGISDHQLLVIAYVTGSVVIVWALVAATLAVVAFRGRRWAWAALLVSTTFVVALCMLAVLGSVLVVVPMLAALTTIALLSRREVREWVRR